MPDTKQAQKGFGILASITSVSERAEIYRTDSVRITTPLERWAYAARVSRESYWHGQPAGGTLYLRMHVVQGEIGCGVLTADNSAFIVERRFAATQNSLVASVPIPSPQVGDLIIRNTAVGSRSRVILYQVSVVPGHIGHPHFAEYV